MSEPLLEVSDIYKTFESGVEQTPVLHGVSFDLKRGESLSITGGSGAGKSTLLHIIGTLEPPTSGTVKFKGQEVSKWSDDKKAEFRNLNLGFVFQFHYLLNEFTAIENVAMPARVSGMSKAESLDKAADLLKHLGMDHRENYFPSSLSGGEQQRVAIARALIMNPGLILADEPTGNLDKKNSQIIKELFLKVVDEYKVGLIVVTHDLNLAESFQRTKHMKDGLWSSIGL